MFERIIQDILAQSIIKLTQLDPVYRFNHDEWQQRTYPLLRNHPYSFSAWQFFNALSQTSINEQNEQALIDEYQNKIYLGTFLFHCELTAADFIMTLSLATQLGATHTLRYLTETVGSIYFSRIKSIEISNAMLAIAINAGKKDAVQFWLNEGASISEPIMQNFTRYFTEYSKVFELAQAIMLVHKNATENQDAKSIALLQKAQLTNPTPLPPSNENNVINPETQMPQQAGASSPAESATSSIVLHPTDSASSSTSSSSQFNGDAYFNMINLSAAQTLIEQAIDKGIELTKFVCFIGPEQEHYFNALVQNHEALYSIYHNYCSAMTYTSSPLNVLLPQTALPSSVTHKNLRIQADFDNIDQLRNYVFGNRSVLNKANLSEIVSEFFNPTTSRPITESIRRSVSQFFQSTPTATTISSFLCHLNGNYIRYVAKPWHGRLLEPAIALRATITPYENPQNIDAVAQKLLAALLIIEIDLANNCGWLYDAESLIIKRSQNKITMTHIDQSHAEALFTLYTQRCRELMLVIKTCDLYQEKMLASSHSASSSTDTSAPAFNKLNVTSIAVIHQLPNAQKHVALEALREAEAWWDQLSREFTQIKIQLVENKAAANTTILTELPPDMQQRNHSVTLYGLLWTQLQGTLFDSDKENDNDELDAVGTLNKPGSSNG